MARLKKKKMVSAGGAIVACRWGCSPPCPVKPGLQTQLARRYGWFELELPAHWEQLPTEMAPVPSK